MEHHIHFSSRKYISAATEFFVSLLILTVWPDSNVAYGQTKYKEITVTNGGTIRGTVKLNGDAGKAGRMEMTQDNKTCGKTKASPRLTVGKNLGVANTFIYIETISEGKHIERQPAYTLNQQRCEYLPHTMIVPLGERLEIVNSDPILHNVHAYLNAKPPKTIFNIAQPMKGLRSKTKPMEKSGLVLATCDAGHPWMFAHIMVADHPYYTITDNNGNYRLEHVPPGSYTLRLWHEGVSTTNKVMGQGKVTKYDFELPYEESRQIVVQPSGEAIADFELVLR